MKQKERIKELEQDIDVMKSKIDGMEQGVGDKNELDAIDLKLINARALVDWESTASVVKHYIVSDLSRLMPIAKPRYAGPLWYVTLNAMTAISGLCYGFANIKRSFIKFAINDMELEEPLAKLLYVCRKTANLGYFPQGVMINAQDRNCDIFEIHEERIIVDVVFLAKEFLRVLESMDYRVMKCKLPYVQGERDIHAQVLEYLRKE